MSEDSPLEYKRAKAGVLTFALALIVGWTGLTSASAGASEPDDVLTPYVDFLHNHQKSAVDYIIGLYDKYDVVVLCERTHPEATQYELILDVVRDPRFVRNVGHVFTEVGTRSNSERVDALLLNGRRTESELRAGLLEIFLNMGDSFPWEKTNYYDFLRGVHELNAALPAGSRVQVHPSGLAFSWDGMDADKMKALRKTLRGRDRDKAMADYIAEAIEARRRDGESSPKALVIMNYRHAMPHMEIRRGERTKQIKNVAGYLLEAWPGRVANVMINTVALLPDSSDEKASITAIADGRWDAAFAREGNPCVGFDFAGSPFGADRFDLWPLPTSFCYADRFTGFVFWKPLSEHRMQRGVGGLLDDAGVSLAVQRLAISRDCPVEKAPEHVAELRSIKVSDYTDPEIFKSSDLRERIDRWLRQSVTAAK